MTEPATPPETGLVIDAEVIRVIDGDTVEVQTTFRHRVRLIDCWCPETRTKDLEEKRRGKAAKHRMGELLTECGSKVRLFLPGHSGDISKLTTMSRVLGRIWRVFESDTRFKSVDDQDLSGIMVSEGFATSEKT